MKPQKTIQELQEITLYFSADSLYKFEYLAQLASNCNENFFPHSGPYNIHNNNNRSGSKRLLRARFTEWR